MGVLVDDIGVFLDVFWVDVFVDGYGCGFIWMCLWMDTGVFVD